MRWMALTIVLAGGPLWLGPGLVGTAWAGAVRAEALPTPPLPPPGAPDASAPVPDRDIPSGIPRPVERVSVGVKVFQPPVDDSGLAFAPGSRFRTPEERKPIQTPGLSVTVPLQ